jgi:hypothetical protein
MSGKFTEEDAENDGKVKREAGQQLNSVLSRKNTELYQKFLQWCDEQGRDPSTVLGDMVLRSMRSDEYAQKVSNTTVNVGKLRRQDIRENDLELVKGLMDEFADTEEDDDDVIDELIRRRLKSAGGGPLGGLRNQMGQQRENNGRRVQELEREIERLRGQVGEGQQEPQQQSHDDTVEVEQGSSKDIDDLFGENDNGNSGMDNGSDSGDLGTDDTGGQGDAGDGDNREEEVEMANMGHDVGEDESVPTSTEEAT